MQVGSALQSVNRLVSLLSSSHVNFSRFETCRTEVLNQPLSTSDIARMERLFKKARTYLDYGKVGAAKYELAIVAIGLRSYLSRLKSRSS